MTRVFELARKYDSANTEYARALGANDRNEGVSVKQCGILRRKKTMAYDAWQSALFSERMLKHNGGTMA